MQTPKTGFEELEQDNQYIYVIISKSVHSGEAYYNSSTYSTESDMRISEKLYSQRNEEYKVLKYKKF